MTREAQLTPAGQMTAKRMTALEKETEE